MTILLWCVGYLAFGIVVATYCCFVRPEEANGAVAIVLAMLWPVIFLLVIAIKWYEVIIEAGFARQSRRDK